MTWEPMWILASSQGTSFPFIQMKSDFGKDMDRRLLDASLAWTATATPLDRAPPARDSVS